MAHGRADARARGFCGACTHIRKVILDAVDLVHAALRRAGGRGSDGGRNLRREGVGSGVRRAGMVAAVLVHSVSSRRSSIGPCRTLTASASSLFRGGAEGPLFIDRPQVPTYTLLLRLEHFLLF